MSYSALVVLATAVAETTFVPLPPGQGTVVAAAEIGPRTLFLNRCADGCLLTPGYEDSRANQSSIIGETRLVPAFAYGDRSWDMVVACTRALYSDFNITVTDVDPGSEPHFEAIVAGHPSDLGFSARVGGVAPFDCGVIENSITFTFAQIWGDDPQRICEVIGQESAHAWGLDHQMLCKDPMTYLDGCRTKCFQNEWADCGEQESRECYCGGNQQNSWQHLASLYGESDGQSPSAQFLSPQQGDVVYPGFHIYLAPELQCFDKFEAWALQGEGDQQVEIYLGAVGSYPYVLNSSPELKPGPVLLRVQATGAQSSAQVEITVTITDELPPVPPDAGPVPDAAPDASPPDAMQVTAPDAAVPTVVDTGAAGCDSGCTAAMNAPLGGWSYLLLLFIALAPRRRRLH